MSAREAAAEAWQRVGDELIAGIHHTLNNRVGALGAVAQVLAMEMPADHPLRAALAAEVQRLHETVGALTLLPLHAGAGEEPVLLSELLPRVVELYGYHHGVRDTACRVEGAASVLPLWVVPTRLAHLLLAMTVAAGEVAREAGGAVVVRCSGDDGCVEVRVGVEGGAGRCMDGVEALAPWAAEMGGSLAREAQTAGGAELVLRLPTLTEVRRRQRGG
jgi:nitrogen-specific signal transduction histidine kinase